MTKVNFNNNENGNYNYNFNYNFNLKSENLLSEIYYLCSLETTTQQ